MAGIDPRFYYLTLGLLILCALVFLVVALRFQREVDDDLAPPTEKDLLGPLEKAYYSGLMREEEFLRIRESMARQKGEDPNPKPRKLKVGPAPAVEPGPAEAEEAEPGPADPPPGFIPPSDDSGPGPGPG